MKLDEPPTTLPFQKSKPEREVGTPCHWPSLPRSSMTCCSSLSFGVYTLRRQQASSSLKKSFSLSHGPFRSEEHTSELQSLMRISYAVFCLKKKKTTKRY